MSLPELLANPPSVSSNPWSLGTLSAAMPNTSTAGAVEQYAVSTTAPTSLRGAQGRFTVAVGGEEMHVFASSTGASPWYFVRGVNGVVQSHSSGDAIYHIPSAGSLRSFRRGAQLRSRLSFDVTRDIRNPGPADNPAVSISAGNAASVITGAAAVPSLPTGYTIVPNDSRFKVTGSGGPLQQIGGTWPQTIKWAALNYVTKTLGNYLPYQLHFDVYASRLEVAMFGNGVQPRIYVNGVLQATSNYTLPNTGNQYNIMLDWTGGVSGANLGYRRVRIDFPATGIIMGMYIAPTEDILELDSRPGGVRMITTGDSWTDGTGSDGTNGFPYQMGRYMGIADSWMAGIGGTGYLQDSSQGSHLGGRLTNDIINNNPDILLLCFGSDDVTNYTPTQVATEASADWEAIMGQLPDCLLVVMGPYACPAAGGSPNYPTGSPMNTALKNAAAGLGVPYIDSIAEKWITGTGYTGATNGTGTSDTLIFTDGIHPSQSGHDYMARRTARRIMDFLEAL